MVKVEILEKESISNLKININNFIKNNKIDVIDIKFEISNNVKYAMIIYRDKQIYG